MEQSTGPGTPHQVFRVKIHRWEVEQKRSVCLQAGSKVKCCGWCVEATWWAHLSLDRGLGSGRRTISALPGRVAGGDLGKLVSREPDFLCKGSSPMAPDMSLSMGQEPARPCDAMGQEPERAWWWWWCGCWAGSVATAPCPASEGPWVGGDEGGERGFFLAAAPDRSFNKPPAFLSF